MKIALGFMQENEHTKRVIRYLEANAMDYIIYQKNTNNWAEIGIRTAQLVEKQICNEGILFCETGTGVSIAANKVASIRAILCNNANIVREAKTWNHANVLCLSYKEINSEQIDEILDNWFSTPYGDQESGFAIDFIRKYEKRGRI